MKITVYAVGSLKERYWREAEAEYLKRLSQFAQIEIMEFSDFPIREDSSPAEKNEIKERESKKILAKLPSNEFLIALDLNHQEYDSEAFSSQLMKYFEIGRSHISFAIGGPLGISDSLRKRANAFMTISKMTFTHQMARVILLEQIYRAFKISRNEPYHR